MAARATVVLALFFSAPAWAQDRAAAPAPEEEEKPFLKLVLPGAFELRGVHVGRQPLTPDSQQHDDLGQENFLHHWIRLSPELTIGEKVTVHGQIDLLRGLLLGDRADAVSAARWPRDEYDGYKNIDPRWLWVEWRPSFGVFRAGQMGSHWGLGILANDGTHESLFGDPLHGDISDRIAFATKPFFKLGGVGEDVVVAIAGDFVFRDSIASVYDGDQAFQGVLASFWQKDERTIGLYAVYRDQTDTNDSYLRVWAFDAYARWWRRVTEWVKADVAFEGALVTGETNIPQTFDHPVQDVRSGGAAMIFGVESPRLRGELELGWASGDADSLDGEQNRFVMDPDHDVGLVLFDEVLAWQTARAATLAQDPNMSGRPARGAELLPTNGGVAGATYVNPRVRFRPVPWGDLRAGALFAWATSDVVDPFHQKTDGTALNSQGGDPNQRDLGIELDLGFEVRWEQKWTTIHGGAQAGMLLPGDAFDDAEGEAMDPVALVSLRLGLTW